MFRLKLLAIGISAVLLNVSVSAATYAVGTCKPSLQSYPHSAAVNGALAGSTNRRVPSESGSGPGS